MNGVFITFEGCEGAGKSVLSEKVYQALLKEGYSVVLTHEPGGTKISDKIREILLSKEPKNSFALVPMAELMLYFASRAQHLQEVILPALESGKVVLCDRFSDTTIAYQGYGRGIDIQVLTFVNDFITGGLSPHYTVLLDTDPKIGLERSKRLSKTFAPEGELDRIESEGLVFHNAVRHGYLEIAKSHPKRVTVYDTSTATLVEILPQIIQQLLKVLQKHALSRNPRSRKN